MPDAALADAAEQLPSDRLPGGPPRAHAAASAFLRLVGHELLGRHRDATPLSVRGPMCSGNLLALMTSMPARDDVLLLAASRTGRGAFLVAPLAPPRWAEAGLTRFADWASAKRAGPCPACGDGSRLDDYHVVAECPVTTAARARAVADLARIAAKVYRLARVAAHLDGRRRDEPMTPAGLEADCRAVAELAASCDWSSPAGCFLLHRLVTLQPWPAAAWPDADVSPAGLLCSTLGRTFDGTVAAPRHLRALANAWGAWAIGCFAEAARAWAAACYSLVPNVQ
jgi:hypothetical protein